MWALDHRYDHHVPIGGEILLSCYQYSNGRGIPQRIPTVEVRKFLFYCCWPSFRGFSSSSCAQLLSALKIPKIIIFYGTLHVGDDHVAPLNAEVKRRRAR